MFYQYINESTIRKAPNVLKIDGNLVLSNSEKTYNENGYYKLQELPLPADGKCYEPVYRLEENIIVKDWRLVESAPVSYKERVVSRIREVYSIDDEIAIIRQRDTKPEEFKTYNDFVETVKAEEKEA